ncbi:MAG: ABC transporter substrate-binding protein [Acidobacteria bacterium]|nr:MAG: ABC transporter substrate-binding protein [Acidobacteriota bacterium]
MRRREFIAGLGSAAVWPVVAYSQARELPVVGYISAGSPNGFPHLTAAFRKGLNEVGLVEGQNVTVERRWAEGRYDRLPELAAELASRRVDVIVNSTGAASAIQQGAPTIPIVSTFGGDPVKSGLVASLNRPGGNLTGVAMFSFALGAKRLEVLREALVNARVIAVLTNASNPDPETKVDAQQVEKAAREVGQQIIILSASSERDFEPAFESMAGKADALLVMADPFFAGQRNQLVALAARHSMPAIYEWREMAAAGGLMSYGSSIADAFRLLGVYAGRILKGAKPADLPIDQAVKIELVLNLRTAKSLGLTFPLSLLGRADEVIE